MDEAIPLVVQFTADAKPNLRIAAVEVGDCCDRVLLRLGFVVAWALLRYEKDRYIIDSFRGFIDKFRLFSNRSEALVVALVVLGF